MPLVFQKFPKKFFQEYFPDVFLIMIQEVPTEIRPRIPPEVLPNISPVINANVAPDIFLEVLPGNSRGRKFRSCFGSTLTQCSKGLLEFP